MANQIVAGDRAARLQRHAGVPANLELEFDDRRSGLEGRLDIPVFLQDDRRLGEDALLIFAWRAVRGEKGRERFDVEGDELCRILRQVCAFGEDRRYRLGPHSGRGPSPILDWLAIGLAEIDGRKFADVIGAPCRPDAFGTAGSLDVDRANSAVGAGRAHNAHMQLCGNDMSATIAHGR